MSKPFVHLHVHTDYSLLDGVAKQDDLLNRAKEMGHEALAFTEHGTLRGLYKQHENASNLEGGPRPIYGVEAYVTSNIEDKQERYGHIILLVKNQEGFSNLFKINSRAYLEGFYYRPRMQADWILEHRAGLVCMTACIGSYFANKDADAIKDLGELMRFREAFGEDFYLEVQPNDLSWQRSWNQVLTRLSSQLGIPLVMTNDSHYVEKGDNLYQEALFCIADNVKLSNPKRRRYDSDQFWFKTYDEMVATAKAFCGYWRDGRIAAMLDQTNEIAEKCQAAIEVDRFKALLPDVPLPEGFDNDFQFLLHLCQLGWEKRDIPGRVAKSAAKFGQPYDVVYQRYIDQLGLELRAFKKQRVVEYFLLVWDVYRMAREMDILSGPGRGSAAGSLACYLLEITNIDPIYHELLFERFMSPERIDLPDIDCDFEDRRRDDLIAALVEKYGSKNCARIATVIQLKGKQCLRDMGRIMEIPRPEVDAVSSSIIERSSGDERASQTVEDSFAEFEVCKQFNEKHPEVLPYVKKLEGCCRNIGVHAAGFVISPQPLEEIIPMEIQVQKGKDKHVPVTGLEMYGCQAFGLVKIDLLGLKNLSVIKDALAAIEERHGKKIDLSALDIDDPKVLANFTARDFVGIFQYDTSSAEKICEDVVFTSFKDVAAMVALNRPGTSRSGLARQYLERKKDPKKIKSIHPIVDEICDDTLGILVYQEQVTKIFVELAGYAPATADSLRKKIAKKWGDETIGRETELFVKGAIERGCPEEVARDLMGKITFFGSYGFNRAHAVAYAMLGYWEQWLKTYYPVEFYWGLLRNEKKEAKPISRIIKDARKHDIVVRPCDINGSGGDWKLLGNELVGALSNIKFVAKAGTREIERKQPFANFIDFLERIDRGKVNKRTVEYLIKGGAFDRFDFNKRACVDNLADIWKKKPTKKRLPDEHKELVKRLIEGGQDWSEEEYEIQRAQVNPVFIGKHLTEPHLPFLQKLRLDWIDLGSDDLWNHKWGFVYGMVIEIRYNQVGDFHSGEEPSDFEKKKMWWGSRYANLNVEDVSGVQQRMKVGVAIFDDFRHVVDLGINTLVCGLAVIDKRWKSIRLTFVHELLALRKKIEAGEPLDVFERCYSAKGRLFKQHPGYVALTHVHRTWDKNENEMCRMGIYDGSSYRECVLFHSLYRVVKNRLKPGMLLKASINNTIVESISDIRAISK